MMDIVKINPSERVMISDISVEGGSIARHTINISLRLPCKSTDMDHIAGYFSANGYSILLAIGSCPDEKTWIMIDDLFGRLNNSGEKLISLNQPGIDTAELSVTAVSGTEIDEKQGADGDILTTYTDGDSVIGFAVSGQPSLTVDTDSFITGSQSGSLSADKEPDNDMIAYNSFIALEKLIAGTPFTMKHLVRTWFYMDDILEWYDDFNRGRTRYFDEQGITGEHIPASTGIGSLNRAGRKLLMGAMFVKDGNSRNSFELLQSPLQCKAGDYSSMFSRAVRVREGLLKTIIISGTASIDISGQTLFTGDAMAQVEMTFEVMEKIAEAAGSDMRNTLRGIAYLPNPYVREMFMTCCIRKNIDTAAIMIIPGIVCRDNLLFELELDLV